MCWAHLQVEQTERAHPRLDLGPRDGRRERELARLSAVPGVPRVRRGHIYILSSGRAGDRARLLRINIMSCGPASASAGRVTGPCVAQSEGQATELP